VKVFVRRVGSSLTSAVRAHATQEHLQSGSCATTGYGDGDLGVCVWTRLGVDVTHEACLHGAPPEDFVGKDDGFRADLKAPCTFHYAFRGAAGRDDPALDRMYEWHERYNGHAR
jgi:hypothetical protein